MSDELQQARIEAVAEYLYDWQTGSVGYFHTSDQRELWVHSARQALAAADAVVTEEMIAETILKALVFTNENSEAWADGLARDIAALFRGGAK